MAAAAELATAQCNRLNDALQTLARDHVKPTVDLDIGPAMAKIATLDAALDKKHLIDVGVESGIGGAIIRDINENLLKWGREGAPGVPMAGPESVASMIGAYDVALKKWRDAGAPGLGSVGGPGSISGAFSDEGGTDTARLTSLLGKIPSALDKDARTASRLADLLQVARRTRGEQVSTLHYFLDQIAAPGTEGGAPRTDRAVTDLNFAAGRLEDAASALIAAAAVLSGEAHPVGSAATAIAGGNEGPIPVAPGPGEGGGGSSGFWGTLLGGAFGGRGGGGGWLSNLLFGGGSGMLGFGPRMFASMGSLGAFAGLGPEHFLMTGVGLAGSMAGAALGGGLLAAGGLGVMGTGMATDLAGLGQAAGDIKNVVQAQNALTQAVAVYGKNSSQAVAAQNQLNYTLKSFNLVARGAVLQAANLAQTFKTQFDNVSGQAEKTGAQIISAFINVGKSFLPMVGRYAAMNMKVLQVGLRPLEHWLTGPQGHGILNSLEEQFSQNLPTAIHAGIQAFELFLKTIQMASRYTGGFLPKIDAFFTKWNSGPGTAKWGVEISHLIGLFHVWWELIKNIGKDIYYLFKADAQTGQDIVKTVTQMLVELGKWERSTRGQSQLHNLFEVHKQEIIALLHLLPPLIEVFGKLELTVAPFATHILTLLIDGFNRLLHMPVLGQILAWSAAILLLSRRITILSRGLGLLFGAIGKHVVFPLLARLGGFISQFGSLGARIGGWMGKLGGTGSQTANTASLDANTVATQENTAALLGKAASLAAGGAEAGAATIGTGAEGGAAALGLGDIAAVAAPAAIALGGVAAALVRINAFTQKNFGNSYRNPNGTMTLVTRGGRQFVTDMTGAAAGEQMNLIAEHKINIPGVHATKADLASLAAEKTRMDALAQANERYARTTTDIPAAMDQVDKALGLTEKNFVHFHQGAALAMANTALATSKSAGDMVKNLRNANNQIGVTFSKPNPGLVKFAHDAQRLLKEGANPQWVEYLAKYAPKELAIMAKGSVAQIQQMNVQFQEHMDEMKLSGANGIHKFVDAVTQGLRSGTPTTVQAAANLVTQMGNKTEMLALYGPRATHRLINAISQGIRTGTPSVVRQLIAFVGRAKIPLDQLGALGSMVGSQLMDGLIGAIEAKRGEAAQLGAGAVLAIHASMVHAAESHSPSKLTARVGIDLMNGLVVGMSSRTKAVIAEAAKIIKRLISAFGNLKHLKSDVRVLHEISAAFSGLNAAIRSLASLPGGFTDVFKHIKGIRHISGNLAAIAPLIDKAIHKIGEAFRHLRVDKGTEKGLQDVSRALSGIVGILQSLDVAQTSLGKLDFGKVFSSLTNRAFLTGLDVLASHLRSTFQKMKGMKEPEKNAKEFSGIIGAVASIVTHLASIQKDAPGLNFTSIAKDIDSLGAIKNLVAPLDNLSNVISKMGKLATMNSRFSQLNTLFANLAALFNNIASTAQNAAGQNIEKEIQVIGTAMNELATGLSNKNLIHQFETLGEKLIVALAEGIKLGKKEAVAAAKSVADAVAAQFATSSKHHKGHHGAAHTGAALAAAGVGAATRDVTDVHISVTAVTNANPHQIAKEVWYEIRPYLSHTAKVK